MVGFEGLKKLMKLKESKIKRLQEEGVKKQYDIDLLRYVFVKNGRARMFNGKQYLEVRTDIPDGTYDYDGNRVGVALNMEMYDFLDIDGVKPDYRLMAVLKDFLEALREALREVNTEKHLCYYLGYNRSTNTLGFYTETENVRKDLAEIEAVDVSKGFEYVLIHNHENLYEILKKFPTEDITIYVDNQRNYIKFYNHKMKLFMGCNSDNFELGQWETMKVKSNKAIEEFYSKFSAKEISKGIEKTVESKFKHELHDFTVKRTFISGGFVHVEFKHSEVGLDDLLKAELYDAVFETVKQFGFKVKIQYLEEENAEER